ncbi:MAG: helicase-related protein [Alistipes finegoldii]
MDNDLKLCLYTDHQIFDRYQRYRINGEIRRDEQMTVAELNQLRPGDYVVHIDHGVGRFDGLVKINENGKAHEAIKLVYKGWRRAVRERPFAPSHFALQVGRRRAAEGLQAGQRRMAEAQERHQEGRQGYFARADRPHAKRKASKGFAFTPDSYLQHELEASFQWEDTPDQQTTVAAVKKDMESDQLWTGWSAATWASGKTEVAIRAAFKAAVDGKQSPCWCRRRFSPCSTTVRFRASAQLPRAGRVSQPHENGQRVSQIRADLEAGRIDILIGTHKILGKQIVFRDLGLLIIDEEQKFGVAAKEKLTQLAVNVDTLTLTATPIPRTLQFSLMGSRDLSVISTPPPNRQPIVTESHVFSEEIIRDAVEAELARGGQVYFVHNRVEDLMSIQGLITRVCPKARVAVGHGKMPAEKLEKLIMDFIYGEFDVLVSTTIIENGIDIPNANTIIVDNAQNFGLSDLHQVRGRVGRSNQKAYCYLLSPPDELLSSDARRRLRAIEEFSDLGSGFNIAMQDPTSAARAICWEPSRADSSPISVSRPIRRS